MSLESIEVQCPYCGEMIGIEVEDLSQDQSYVEDCGVCCRPIQFNVSKVDDELDVTASRSD